MWDLYKKLEGFYFGKSQVLRDLPVPTQKAFARHEGGSRCLRLERERGLWGAALCRCWWEESCGWPAQGELCGAAHRPCASALLTHSGAGGDLGPCWPLENTRETFLSHLGWRSLSDRECLLRAASLLCCHLAAAAGRAGDPRLLTRWQITFEKRICQFCSVFVIERSPLLSAAPRAVHPTALSCPRSLPWHMCPDHTAGAVQ